MSRTAEVDQLELEIEKLQELIDEIQLAREMINEKTEVEVKLKYEKDYTRRYHNRTEVFITLMGPERFQDLLDRALQDCEKDMKYISDELDEILNKQEEEAN